MQTLGLGIGIQVQQIGEVIRHGGTQLEGEVKNFVIFIIGAGTMSKDGMEIQFTQMEHPILVLMIGV